MQSTKPIHKINTATEANIFEHLQECSSNFTPPLSERVDLKNYAEKIKNKAITFEAWNDKALIGLIASYVNTEKQSAFITNVSVTKSFMGKGISSSLLKRCIEYLKENKYSTLSLEVKSTNINAIALYKKFHFEKYDSKDGADFMRLEIL